MSDQIDSSMKAENAEPEFKQFINKKGMPEKTAEEEAKLLEDQVTYIQYEELTDFEADHPFSKDYQQFMKEDMIKETLDKELWRDQFDTLGVLRQIQKFHQEKFIENLGIYNEFLKLSVQNLRSGIAKNSLMLSHEFLKTKVHTTQSSIDFVKAVLPGILTRTVYDKKFISLTGVATMKEAVTNCLFLECLQVILETGCASKIGSKQLVVNGFVYATPFIKNVDLSLLQDKSHETIKLMVQMIGMGVDGMPNIKKAAIETAKALRDKIGADNFQAYLEEVLNSDVKIDNEESKEEEKNKKMVTKIMSNFTEKKKVVRAKPNFKAFVQKQKTLVSDNLGEQPLGEPVVIEKGDSVKQPESETLL